MTGLEAIIIINSNFFFFEGLYLKKKTLFEKLQYLKQEQ